MTLNRTSGMLAGMLAVALALAACGGAQSRFAAHMKRGEDYFSHGDYVKAKLEFRNALQIEPRNPAALLRAARSEDRLGHAREAAGLFQATIDAAPDTSAPQNLEARRGLGKVLVANGAGELALTTIEPALTAHPEDAQLLVLRAAARAELGKLSDAIADADHALRLDPTDTAAVEVRAGLYKRAGDLAGAQALVSAAAEKSPREPALHQMLADLYLAAGEQAKAEDQLRTLITLAPQEPRYRYQLANFYAGNQRLDDAQHVLEEAVAAMPHRDQVKLALVEFVSTQRSRAQAEQILRSDIAREPDNEELRLGLGTLLQRTGTPDEAIAAYEEIITRNPRSPNALVARDRIAAIQLGAGHTDEASREIAAVLEKSPRDSAALSMRGSIALQRDDPAAAIEDLRAVLRDQPNAIDVQRTLARAYIANGQSALAEDALRAALQAAPAFAPVRLDLAELLLQTGRGDAAAALLEEAVRQAPDDESARQALVRVYLAKHDYAKARVAAEDMKTKWPASVSGPYLAGLVAQQQGRFADGEREFERALQLEPTSMDALSALSRLQIAHGQGVAAVARLRVFALAHPEDPKAVNLLGEALIATRSYREAAQQLERATQLAPQWALPYQNLALARLASQDQVGAAAVYQAGLKRLPDEPLLVAGLADLYEQQGHAEEAIALYEGLYARHPHLDMAANNLAMLLATYRTDQRSLDRARQLTAAYANAQSGALLDTNGWVLLKLGDVAGALPTLERAADRAPASRVIHYHLAMAQLKAGQRDKARANLETALSGSAHFAGSDEARATLDSLNAGKS